MDELPNKELTAVEATGEKRFMEDIAVQKLSKRWYLRPITLEMPQLIKLQERVSFEIDSAKRYIEPWLERKYKHLKLYNNQMRDDNKVGEPILFTGFQTLLAATYDDILNVTFKGRTEADYEKSPKLNYVAEYDYDLMEKAVYDFHMRWNSLFFGRSTALMMDYDKELFVPQPTVIDPLVLLIDPAASSVNGTNIGNNASHLGFEVTLFERDLAKKSGYFQLEKVEWTDNNEDGSSLQAKAKDYRDQASAKGDDNFNTYENEDGERKAIGFRWFTKYKGKNIVLTVANKGEVIIRADEINDDEFPFVEMCVFPTPNDFHGVSVPDIAEDKQRMKAVLTNMGIKLLDINLHSKKLYNVDQVLNPEQLHPNFEGDVEVDGDPRTATYPLQEAKGDLGLYDYLNNQLDVSVQKGLATPEIQQGVLSSTERTLGELNLVANASNNRYSLMIKMMALSEKEFWNRWYMLHKAYLPDSAKKFVRISGEINDTVEQMSRSEFLLEIDPDIDVESKSLEESKRVRNLQYFAQFYGILRSNPTANTRYLDKLLARMIGLSQDQINLALPPTPDELIATEENYMLNENRIPTISVNDNHIQHLEIHGRANFTNAKIAHMLEHLKAMRIMVKEGIEIPPVGVESLQSPHSAGQSAPPPQQGAANSAGGVGANAMDLSSTMQ